MKKNFSLIIALFFPFLVVGAQPPKSTDLMEEGGLQRRDLSIEGSRIVINPYDFDKNPDEITPVVYSNASSLPLNVAYLSTNNNDKGNRFGREVKKLLLLLTDTGEGYSEALTYQTQWMPHALPFSATYPQNVYVEGTDFFYDENTLVRSVRFRSNIRIVLAGSIPSSMSDNIYRDIMADLKDRGVMIVVDATKDLLLNVLEYHPFLIKPNNHELGEIFDVKLTTREEVIPYGRKLQEKGARNVLVSMAGEGAVLIAEDGQVFDAPAPKGKLINGVGAGDSMVAGFVAGWIEKQDYEYAFHMGVASGSASAFSENLATKEEIINVYNQVMGK